MCKINVAEHQGVGREGEVVVLDAGATATYGHDVLRAAAREVKQPVGLAGPQPDCRQLPPVRQAQSGVQVSNVPIPSRAAPLGDGHR
jgi:hypothetical protein